MSLTNKLNLPAPLVAALTNDPYDKGHCDFSLSELLSPPRARVLIKQHKDAITEDASDHIWALLGQIGHTILERSGDPHIVEHRFFATIKEVTISGRADLILAEDSTQLIDYKFCSVWTVKEGIKPEWQAQCNMLAWLASQNGVAVTKASIVAIYRDWSKPRASRERDYPQQQVGVLPVTLWTSQEQTAFIIGRIEAHHAAEKELPLCTNEERWMTPEVWAVKKPKNKRAERLFNTQVEADSAAYAWGMIIEHRLGEAKRCACYCQAYDFCRQANPKFQDQD